MWVRDSVEAWVPLSKMHAMTLLNDTELGRSIPCNGDSYEFLRLKDNDLEGSLPGELSLLSSLKGIALEGNKITGTIPTEIAMLGLLEEVLLFAGQLTGTIPSEFGLLSQVKVGDR